MLEHSDLIDTHFAHMGNGERQHLKRWLNAYLNYLGKTTPTDELLRRVATFIQGLVDHDINLYCEREHDFITARIQAYDKEMIEKARKAREKNPELMRLARDNNAENIYGLLEAAFNLGIASVGTGGK
jgi:hypothetical protein